MKKYNLITYSVFFLTLFLFSFGEAIPSKAEPSVKPISAVKAKTAEVKTPTTTKPNSTKKEQNAERKKAKKVKLKNKQLEEIEIEYKRNVEISIRKTAGSLLHFNLKSFIKRLKKDLLNKGISDKVILRNINFSSELDVDAYKEIIMNGIFSIKNESGEEKIEFIPNERKNGLFYLVTEEGLDIEKGAIRTKSFLKFLKKKNLKYYGDMTFYFIGRKLYMEVIFYDEKGKIVFQKRYAQRYNQYGIIRYKEREVRLAIGIDSFLPNLMGNFIKPPGPGFNLPIFIVPNISAGVLINRVGVTGAQVDFGLINKFDYFSMKWYLNADLMEMLNKNPIVHLMWELQLGGGLQFMNTDYSTVFFAMGTGFRMSIADLFYLRAGININLNKNEVDNGISFIKNAVMPPNFNFGIGVYIL